MRAVRGLVEERCRREQDVEECERVYRGINKEEAYLVYVYGAPNNRYAYVIVLTSDKHLLLYRRNSDILMPRERTRHIVLSEEGAKLLREKMMAVKTVEDFWSLFEELKEEIDYYCREKKGDICIEDDTIRYYLYDFEDEYLWRD
ncbi:MAG: hypothetical protein ACO2PN_23945 [Pyrobaculum sp.]|jgi:hypothetical protein